MTFKKIDEDAYSTGYPASSALGAMAHRNAAACWTDLGRAAGVSYLYTDPPRLAGMPVGVFGEMERVVVPFLWRKAPGATTLRLQARVESMRSGLGVQLGIVVGRPGELIGRVIPADEDQTSTSSGVETLSLEADIRRFAPDDLILVLLTATSTLSEDYEAFTTAGYTDCIDAVEPGWYQVHNNGHGHGWYDGSSITPWTDDLEPWVVEFGSNLSAFSKQPDFDGAFGDRRLGLRFDDDKIFVYPPLTAGEALAMQSVAPLGWWVIRRAQGYVKLYGVSLDESAFEVVSAEEERAYHIGQVTGAATGDLLLRRQLRVFQERGRIHSIGNGPDYGRADNAASLNFTSRLANAGAPRIQVLDADVVAGVGPVPVFGCVVTAADTFEDTADTYHRQRHRVDVLGVCTTYARGASPRCELEYTLAVGDLNAAADDEATSYATTPTLHVTSSNNPASGTFAGQWFHFLGAEVTTESKRIRHCLSGCVPASVWPAVGWTVGTVEVLHTETSDPRVELELSAAATGAVDTREVWLTPAAVLAGEVPGATAGRLGVAV